MSAAQVIASYESLRALTGRMREAASGCEWESMIDLGKARDVLLESIKPLDADTTLDVAAVRRKDELIEEILGHDQTIRDAVHDWMRRFEAERRNSQQELRLLKEYGV
jgi:flagellar protein FliT